MSCGFVFLNVWHSSRTKALFTFWNQRLSCSVRFAWCSVADRFGFNGVGRLCVEMCEVIFGLPRQGVSVPFPAVLAVGNCNARKGCCRRRSSTWSCSVAGVGLLSLWGCGWAPLQPARSSLSTKPAYVTIAPPAESERQRKQQVSSL